MSGLKIAVSHPYTNEQRAFIAGIVSGLDKKDAAIKAGYDHRYASDISLQMLQQPAIIAAIQIGLANRFARGAPMMMNVLEWIALKEDMHPKLRLDAAKDWLNRAGHIAPKAVAPGAKGETPLNEMTMSELRSLADKLENELATRAKPVSSAKAAPSNVQTLDDIM